VAGAGWLEMHGVVHGSVNHLGALGRTKPDGRYWSGSLVVCAGAAGALAELKVVMRVAWGTIKELVMFHDENTAS
jgi:hypothetical protein